MLTRAFQPTDTVKIAAIRKAGEKDIIRPRWIFDCLQHRYLLPLEPERYVLHALLETAEKIQHNVDGFMDSYARDVDVPELRKILEEMPLPNHDTSLAVQFRDSQDMEDVGELPGWIFRECVVHSFPKEMYLAKSMVEFAGGAVNERLTQGVITHVVVPGIEQAEEVRKELAGW